MNDVKWIKITTDIFDDEKILLIESLPAADSIITIWFKLLTLAGKQNNNGVFLMNDKIAYTDEMLSTIFRRDLQIVRLALKTFQEFEMIDIVDGVITIPNWNKHQTLDSYEAKKARDRIYQANRHEKQREIAKKSSDSRLTSSLTVDDSSSDKSSDVAISDGDKEEDKEREREIDIEIEEDKESILTVSKETVCRTEVRQIIEKWNTLSVYGIKPIRKIGSGTQVFKRLCARVREYGIEEVLSTIDMIKDSDFLLGKVKEFTITLDWFSKPNNFQKVYNGNYSNSNPKRTYQSQTAQMLDNFYDQTAEWVRKMEQEEQENDC